MSLRNPIALAALMSALTACAPAPDLTRVVANDNRRAAGIQRGDTLHLRLVVRMADWYAESDTGPMVHVAAFAEEARAPEIPAPMIRVHEGTIISAWVRNALTDSTIRIVGLSSRPAAAHDTIVLAPGETKSVTFAAGDPGTYFYAAILGNYAEDEREQAAGAFIVDPADGSPPDRVFVMNIWGTQVDSNTFSNALAINGRSWPWTERLEETVGDTLRWRVINATIRPHPMHLHGSYYRVDSRGDAFADTIYADSARSLVVTENMRPRQTMTMVWSPTRPGRWLFHCHIAFHVIPTDARVVPDTAHGAHTNSVDPLQHMAGLVLGITAKLPPGAREPARGTPRTLDLYVQQGRATGRSSRALSFVLQEGATPPAPDSVRIPGSLLVLTRGEATDVRVHNRLDEPVSIHWHGLELESYSDGVAGWSGDASRTAPVVAPGGSFTAKLESPRAGTFIYHTHVRDVEQLTAGMYGPLVVVEPGTQFDAARDHVHTLGWDGPRNRPVLLINGDSISAPPIAMMRGETHRFRFINIGPGTRFPVSLRRGAQLAEWRAAAKDGAELPSPQRTQQSAMFYIMVGETYDFEFTPPDRGTYTLQIPNGKTGPDSLWTRRVIVR